jgi:hypothetical protein
VARMGVRSVFIVLLGKLEKRCHLADLSIVGNGSQIAARSQVWVCGRLLAGVIGYNPAMDMDVCCCVCCVLSGRSLCVGAISSPEESKKSWCV